MDDFPPEFVETFRICFDLMERVNFSIFDKQGFIKHRFPFFIVLCILGHFVSLSVCMYTAVSEETQFFELVDAVPVLVVVTQGIFKSAIVVLNRTEIRVIILQLGSMWRTTTLTDVQINKKNALLKRLNFSHSAFYWLNIIGSWQYMLAPLLETLFRRFVMQQECEWVFPFACSYPFNPKKDWLSFIATYIFQCYAMFHIIYIYLGGEFLMISLCALLSTKFSLLQDDLRIAKPTPNQNGVGNDTICHADGFDNGMSVNDIIRKHQKLIMLSHKTDEVFNKMIFINLLFATVTICFFGFVAKVARSPTDMFSNFIGIFASMLPIFNLCYYGNLLMEASAGVADAAYQNSWIKHDIKYQKSICIIMKRSQTACCLTSLKYAPITLKTFSSVLSTTWSYFSLANRLYEEEA